jgi:hypothetical protein
MFPQGYHQRFTGWSDKSTASIKIERQVRVFKVFSIERIGGMLVMPLSGDYNYQNALFNFSYFELSYCSQENTADFV